MSDYIKKLLVVLGVIIFTSCEKPEDDFYPHPCIDQSCDSVFFIDQTVQPNSYKDSNGYWHIEYWGPSYFTVKGELDELNPEYITNDVPSVAAVFDSNYWIAFDDLSFTIPMYSPFGLYNQQGKPIPVGNETYDISEIAKLMEPLNIAGYQITKNTCFDCPYSDRLFATYSRYTYKPQQQMYLDRRMVGDTLEVYVQAQYNPSGLDYLGNTAITDHVLKIIVHDELPCKNNGFPCN